MYKELEAFSKMMSMPKSTLVSIVMIDGVKRYVKRDINVNAIRSAPEKMLKGTSSSHSIKFSIKEDKYGEINNLINGLNKAQDIPITMRSLFYGFWLWYRENVFKNLKDNITNLRSREREMENAIDSFYKNKAIDYGVPVSNLQSFYLAEMLDIVMNREVEISSAEMRKDTRMFLDPFDME